MFIYEAEKGCEYITWLIFDAGVCIVAFPDGVEFKGMYDIHPTLWYVYNDWSQTVEMATQFFLANTQLFRINVSQGWEFLFVPIAALALIPVSDIYRF